MVREDEILSDGKGVVGETNALRCGRNNAGKVEEERPTDGIICGQTFEVNRLGTKQDSETTKKTDEDVDGERGKKGVADEKKKSFVDKIEEKGGVVVFAFLFMLLRMDRRYLELVSDPLRCNCSLLSSLETVVIPLPPVCFSLFICFSFRITIFNSIPSCVYYCLSR